jgi:hypothetical protein
MVSLLPGCVVGYPANTGSNPVRSASGSLTHLEKPELPEKAEVIPASPVFDDLVTRRPPDVGVSHGELLAGRLATHERAGVASAHDHQLDDLVALGDLVLNLEPKVAEGVVELPHCLLDALGTGRLLWVSRLVIHEVGVDELVRDLEVAVRVDLLESSPDQSLVVLRRGRRPHPLTAAGKG